MLQRRSISLGDVGQLRVHQLPLVYEQQKEALCAKSRMLS